MLALFTPKNLLPAVVAIAATFFLVDAVPRAAAPIIAPVAGFDLLQAEVHACEFLDGRLHDACADEAMGKELIRRAESLRLAEDGAAVHL